VDSASSQVLRGFGEVTDGIVVLVEYPTAEGQDVVAAARRVVTMVDGQIASEETKEG